MKISKEKFDEAKDVAKQWQLYIDEHREPIEQKFHGTMLRMLKDPINKIFLIELLDQSFRSKNPHRVADQIEYIFSKYKDSSFLSAFEEMLVLSFRKVGIYMTSISIPIFIKYLRNDIKNVVIPGEEKALVEHIKKRKVEGTRVNINIIGEIVLGEEEADERVQKYIKTLQNPHIDYISIKISTIFSQINPLAHEWSVGQISNKLEKIYNAALQNRFVDANGKESDKFVNLDMEEYKDVRLTIDVFKKTLSFEKFKSLHAGIVLQTYLPDTLELAKELSIWAKQRVQNGGAPIKIRLVKGANQEMELTEASLRGWECVTYRKKAQSDANFKLIIDYLLDPDVAPYVHLGVASHNLFDHALGMLLSRERGVEKFYTAEMLEGMSETAYKVLKKEGLNVILYAPTATKKTFTNAIAYLVRRFDENTAEQNFLRHSFGLKVDSEAWKTLVKSYDDALEEIKDLKLTPYRVQDRNREPAKPEIDLDNYIYESEADTDFVLEQNKKWAIDIANKWKNIAKEGGYHARPVVASKEIENSDIVEVIDKSQYHKGIAVGSYVKAAADDMHEAVRVAKEDIDGWRKLTTKERQKILMDVAHEFRKRRADLIGVAAAEVGKVFGETDVEVSEAIDFLNFYPYSVRKIEALEGVHVTPKGVGLVVSPWNFPVAIPAGGIAAALASGNTVILKPASDSVLCAQMVCECFWSAGVSRNTLQFLPSSGALAGEELITNRDIDFTIFTGGEQTAYSMIKQRSDIHLSAETGGKDATIVTSMADRDQAVKNVVASAFSNSGQKCSATSLLVLEDELYNDENFKKMLADAANSLEVGSVWDFKNKIGALSSKPSGNLEKALSYLDDGEEWLLPPSYAESNNPYMLKPSIRWGTSSGDFCHMNELFGPVLSVMRADDLEDAIDVVNSTGYGLTSGIESLDEREQEIWREKLRAGNLYINRGTTGAIVIRQPFGGMGKSAIGSGKKAGGFNYVTQFMNIGADEFAFQETHAFSSHGVFANEVSKASEIAKDFLKWHREEFGKEHDYANVRGESNIIRYLGVKSVLLRCQNGDKLHEILASITAVKIAGATLHISLPKKIESDELAWLINNSRDILAKEDLLELQDEGELIESMKKVQRVRFLNPKHVTKNIYDGLKDEAKHIAREPFVSNGRVELLHYFIEQSVTNSYHRYGNLGIRGLEDKANARS
ncbi:MAG: bifunctional proline dehydrogenase/L-glutamate gamma-semialdehyde dehydrogenase [Sulfurimonas sp.]|uniref:bifunctional proline dehydrogenase/L-glutamate gamma-semialdehyde dehydrogenase n=1 Tax=Sulfurimonas sp. TaxID=2022749 RepID=UPI0028CC1245|nr:bifunctional proline dehydrogenase/L-glutamate gamma-semialdehyde dehydrogenase [Sulfurimonas sp.]MDT8337831.1 bifunctional proline dehydrogenase/L-glutamate gamma-semialdehyde dehydrogenase [Sulfurimonas sp.]